MTDTETLWEKMKPILISHGFCDEIGKLRARGRQKYMDCGVSAAVDWNDVFSEGCGRLWLPVTDDPDGSWQYYWLPGAITSPYKKKCAVADLMRLARILHIDNELAGYDLQTASELLDDDMLDI